MKVDVIVGGLYGDEGKGKIVSYFGNLDKYDYVFRVNASTNASHTVATKRHKELLVTKQLPSIFFNEDIKYVVGPGAILNLKALKDELLLRPDDIKDRLSIASTIVLLIEPYIEMTINSDVAKKLGSTNQGTGMAIVARSRRHCIRLLDIKNFIDKRITHKELFDKIDFSCSELDKDFFNRIKSDKVAYIDNLINDLVNDYMTVRLNVGEFVVDYTDFLTKMPYKSSVLIEGCNGIMLDNLHGLHPYTTSASTSINALLNGANISPYELNETFIACTAYFCCLNKRPFLTEMTEEESQLIYNNNAEIDDAEGMRRRLGWFDLPTLVKALIGHKNCSIVLNKVDIMKDCKTIKLCTHYTDKNGKMVNVMPDDILDLMELKPHYRTFDGWGNKDGSLNLEKIKDFVDYINNAIQPLGKIKYLGVGRYDEDIIKLD